MAFSAAFFINAFIIARKKKDKKWMKTHRSIATAGVISVLAGFLAMLINKIINSYPHFTSPHALCGLAALIFAPAALILGTMILKGKKVRPAHKLFGRAGIIIVIITAILGVLVLALS